MRERIVLIVVLSHIDDEYLVELDISEVEKMETILSENPFIGKRTNYQLLVLKIVILRSFYIYYTVSDNTVSILAFKATKEDNNKHQLGI